MFMKGVLAIAMAASLPVDAEAATATRENGGTLADGRKTEAIVLKNTKGVSARILAFGATLQGLTAPDRRGHFEDIVLGLPDAGAYEAKQPFFGVTVGRYANRIAGGKFTLDGTTYSLPLNDKVNSLHGGGKGFDVQLWTVESVKSGPVASVTLSLVSPEGDSGYPGELHSKVVYSLDEAGNLTIAFSATTTRPTIVNMTNHALFNLAGQGGSASAMDHILTIPASRYTPVNAALIPTGELRNVAGTAFDFRSGRKISLSLRKGEDSQLVIGRGYDHNFVIDAGLTAKPKLVARLVDPASGRAVDVLSTEPGVQLYTGNFIDGTVLGKNKRIYRMGDGVALEPQKFPDTPNQPAFGSARVEPGKPYSHTMVYRLSVMK